ncbi:hypothetical protein Tco_1109585 [Tanacetum coccineum]
MTKKINVHPEWLILQTLTNGAKRKLDHLLLHLVNGLLWKTNEWSGTPFVSSGWKTSGPRRDDKEDQCDIPSVLWKTNEMRVGPLVLILDGKLLGPRRMTKKINVHPEWLILQTLTNGAKRKLDHLLLHLVNGLLWKTNDESGTPRSQSGWKTSWAKKDDKEDQCCCRKLMMRVGPLVLSLDGKILGPRRMTNNMNVHPELFILQTLTNGAKRKLDHLLFHLSRDPSISVCERKLLGAKNDDKEEQCSSRVVILSTLTNRAKRKLEHLLFHLEMGLLWKTNDESGTPRSQSGWKTSWAKKDDNEDECAS